jgi:hypothetical protein
MLTLLQQSDRKQIEEFLESVKPQAGIYDYRALDTVQLRSPTFLHWRTSRACSWRSTLGNRGSEGHRRGGKAYHAVPREEGRGIAMVEVHQELFRGSRGSCVRTTITPQPF